MVPSSTVVVASPKENTGQGMGTMQVLCRPLSCTVFPSVLVILRNFQLEKFATPLKLTELFIHHQSIAKLVPQRWAKSTCSDAKNPEHALIPAVHLDWYTKYPRAYELCDIPSSQAVPTISHRIQPEQNMVKTVYYSFSVHRTLGASHKPRIPQNCPCPRIKQPANVMRVHLPTRRYVTKTEHLQTSERGYGARATTKAMFRSELALLSVKTLNKLHKYAVQGAAWPQFFLSPLLLVPVSQVQTVLN